MAVKRVWFINIPSGTIDALQRIQIGIGYPFSAGAPVPIFGELDYFRCYLDDPSNTFPNTIPTPYSFPSTHEDLTYIRRWLSDPS